MYLYNDQCCLRSKFIVFTKKPIAVPPQQSKKRKWHEVFQDSDDEHQPQDKEQQIIDLVKKYPLAKQQAPMKKA